MEDTVSLSTILGGSKLFSRVISKQQVAASKERVVFSIQKGVFIHVEIIILKDFFSNPIELRMMKTRYLPTERKKNG